MRVLIPSLTALTLLIGSFQFVGVLAFLAFGLGVLYTLAAALAFWAEYVD
jgi:hypothetical protein